MVSKGAEITNATINNAAISDGTINNAAISDGTITNAAISYGSISYADITYGHIGYADIGNCNLTGTLTASGGGTLSGGTVSGANIVGAGGAFNVNEDGTINCNGWEFLPASGAAFAGSASGSWVCSKLMVGQIVTAVTSGNALALGKLAFANDIKKKIKINNITANRYHTSGGSWTALASGWTTLAGYVYNSTDSVSAGWYYSGISVSSTSSANTVYFNYSGDDIWHITSYSLGSYDSSYSYHLSYTPGSSSSASWDATTAIYVNPVTYGVYQDAKEFTLEEDISSGTLSDTSFTSADTFILSDADYITT